MPCTLKDLGAEDKQKVAKLLQKVVDLTQELEEAERKQGLDSKRSAAKRRSLKQRSKTTAAENASLKAQLAQTLKLLDIYQQEQQVACTQPSPGRSQQQEQCGFPQAAGRDIDWIAQTTAARDTIAAIEAEYLRQIFQTRSAEASIKRGWHSSGQQPSPPGNLGRARHHVCPSEGLLELVREAEEWQVGSAGCESSQEGSHRPRMASREPRNWRPLVRKGPFSESCLTDGQELLRVIYETDSDITHCTA